MSWSCLFGAITPTTTTSETQAVNPDPDPIHKLDKAMTSSVIDLCVSDDDMDAPAVAKLSPPDEPLVKHDSLSEPELDVNAEVDAEVDDEADAHADVEPIEGEEHDHDDVDPEPWKDDMDKHPDLYDHDMDSQPSQEHDLAFEDEEDDHSCNSQEEKSSLMTPAQRRKYKAFLETALDELTSRQLLVSPTPTSRITRVARNVSSCMSSTLMILTLSLLVCVLLVHLAILVKTTPAWKW